MTALSDLIDGVTKEALQPINERVNAVGQLIQTASALSQSSFGPPLRRRGAEQGRAWLDEPGPFRFAHRDRNECALQRQLCASRRYAPRGRKAFHLDHQSIDY